MDNDKDKGKRLLESMSNLMQNPNAIYEWKALKKEFDGLPDDVRAELVSENPNARMILRESINE